MAYIISTQYENLSKYSSSNHISNIYELKTNMYKSIHTQPYIYIHTENTGIYFYLEYIQISNYSFQNNIYSLDSKAPILLY